MKLQITGGKWWDFRAARTAGLWLVFFCLACNAAVELEPEPTSTFSYNPDLALVNIAAGHFRDFQVIHAPDPVFTVAWEINGVDVGFGPRFRYLPATTRVDTLTAIATWENHTDRRTWLVDSMYDLATNVEFSPTADLMDIVTGDTCRFFAESSRAPLSTYLWELGGEPVGTGASYLLNSSKTGIDTLRATVVTPDHTISRLWDLRVFEADQLPPLPPTDFFVQPGAAPATVETFWRVAAPRGEPIIGYEIGISYTGPLDNSNWQSAILLGETPTVPGQEIYLAAFADTINGLIPGAHAWLGIRSINQTGIRSLNLPNMEVDITRPWWATGVVRDDAGVALADVTVRTTTSTFTTQTEADGTFRIGPFRSIDYITLRTETLDIMPDGEETGAWTDILSGPLFFGQSQHWDCVLLTMYRLDSTCTTYAGSFPAFLRGLTHTERDTDLRPNQNLYKWESYPVTVWVPDYISPENYDYGVRCRQVVAMWNETMDEDYLTLVSDPADASIVFRFGDDGNATLGKTSLLEPSGRNYILGDIIPEKVEVYVRDRLNTVQFVQEVAMHELGHALGLVRHVACADGDYLMYLSPAGMLDDGVENAINPDERHALRLVRALPQGYDMSLLR